MSFDDPILDVIPSRAGHKLCVRHKLMANQDVNSKLQKSLDNLPVSERSAVTHLWSTFSTAPHAKRKLILEGILTMCCFSQLSHLSDSLNLIIRVDPFSILPREVNMRVLGYLDAISLGRAAQVSKSWKALADDDLLWRRMCGQHIDRKCEKCGWGLPLLERRRLKVELQDGSPSVAVGIGDHQHGDHMPTTMVTREQVLGKRDVKETEHIPENLQADSESSGESSRKRHKTDARTTTQHRHFSIRSDFSLGSLQPSLQPDSRLESRLTRPWKDVYCERLRVERNWRKGRCITKTLKGHASSVMCLQYHTTLTNPSYPVLITGSYDQTVKIWNMETGTVVKTLTGHTRAVRALQFDQMLLFTGSMDGTVRMWNWRAGDCLRVLEAHTDGVVALNYNGYLLATGSADTTIHVWNFRSGNHFSLPGHDDWVSSVVLWDGKTSPGDFDPTQMPSFTRHRGTSPDPTPGAPEFDAGAMLFSAGDDGDIKLWDLATKECVRVFSGHKAPVQSLRVLMVDTTASEEERTEHNTQSTPRNSSLFAPASSLTPSPPQIAAQLSTAVLLHSKKSSHGELYVGKRAVLASGSLDGTVKLWDIEKGTDRSTLFGHIEGVWTVDIDALRIASGSYDRTIKVWDPQSGDCVQTLVGHRGAVNTLQLSDDMIVSGSDDGDVMVWNFAPTTGPLTPQLTT
ncbi:quinon protein alcohol dehydrogenase-like superfamily [Kockovaella imperatae]|uniref:Quinon protein alcohol dehydrogenase-like superfamily n=1 Tax=Kockovaella imperatae TaxID=4999 RepID=A0A1Y1UP97_9TREE|nr:quinon protein alcohol dehydrogenase-like superfamily [Kockovaella imperatae]ORX39377.1 quinon protein alcohol dehydrogenase-like superfamily [Kockovaella imperatae]